MSSRRRYLAKPLYESLPALYGLGGAIALAIGYRLGHGWLSAACSLLGLAGLLVAVVLWLHRRDYRSSRNEYQQRGAPLDQADRDQL
jgi:uncharacterized membrane protein